MSARPIGAPSESLTEGAPPNEPDVRIFNPEEAQEKARGWTIAFLCAAFGLEIVVMLAAWLAYGRATSDIKDVAGLIFTPTATLFGTALGFYFSRK